MSAMFNATSGITTHDIYKESTVSKQCYILEALSRSTCHRCKQLKQSMLQAAFVLTTAILCCVTVHS